MVFVSAKLYDVYDLFVGATQPRVARAARRVAPQRPPIGGRVLRVMGRVDWTEIGLVGLVSE